MSTNFSWLKNITGSLRAGVACLIVPTAHAPQD